MGYCPAHDPNLWAPFFACTRCGGSRGGLRAVDADWMDGGLILATYEPACEHARPVTILVNAAPGQPARWCIALARSGLPCRNRRACGWVVCARHRDLNLRAIAECPPGKAAA